MPFHKITSEHILYFKATRSLMVSPISAKPQLNASQESKIKDKKTKQTGNGRLPNELPLGYLITTDHGNKIKLKTFF